MSFAHCVCLLVALSLSLSLVSLFPSVCAYNDCKRTEVGRCTTDRVFFWLLFGLVQYTYRRDRLRAIDCILVCMRATHSRYAYAYTRVDGRACVLCWCIHAGTDILHILYVGTTKTCRMVSNNGWQMASVSQLCRTLLRALPLVEENTKNAFTVCMSSVSMLCWIIATYFLNSFACADDDESICIAMIHDPQVG